MTSWYWPMYVSLHTASDFTSLRFPMLRPRVLTSFCLFFLHVQDVYSWNIEQAQGHTANIITVLMNQKNIPVQEAMDIVGQEVQKRFQLYSLSKSQLPSWGTEVDKGVQAYATVLEDWTIGSIRWSLQSKRYFTKSAPYDPKTFEVKILPKEQKTATDLRTAKVKLSAVSQTALVWGSIWVCWLFFTAIVVLHLAPHLLPTRSPVFSS